MRRARVLTLGDSATGTGIRGAAMGIFDWLKGGSAMSGAVAHEAPGTPGVLTDGQADEVRQFLRAQLRAGYLTPEDAAASTIECMADEYPEDAVCRAVEVALPAEMEALRAEADSWPEVTDYDRLVAAFAAMERAGIVARENYSCCMNCGSVEIRAEIRELPPEERERVVGYVFFHEQDTERAVEGDGVYLCFGPVDGSKKAALAVATTAVEALRAEGLQVEWDGKVDRRPGVTMNWQRRPPWLS